MNRFRREPFAKNSNFPEQRSFISLYNAGMTQNSKKTSEHKYPYLHITARFCIAVVFFVLLIAVILIPLFSRGVLRVQTVADRSTLPPGTPVLDGQTMPPESLNASSSPEAEGENDTSKNTATPEAVLVLAHYTTLKPGDDNAAVEKLQQRLMELGYLDQDEPSTYYNTSIENAVILFQRACSIKQTGIADEQMQTMLFSDDAQTYRIKESDAGADVLNLQQRLNELGYYTGRSNGYFGPLTVQAVKEFQYRNNLSADGILDYGDWEILYSQEAKESDSEHPAAASATPASTKAAAAGTKKPSATKAPGKSTPKPTAKPGQTSKASEQPRFTPAPQEPELTPEPQVPTKAPSGGEIGNEDTPTPFAPDAPEYTPEPTAAPTKKPDTGGGSSGGSYSNSASGLCEAAAAQMGKPYVWGNRGPDSFDCSGMVYYCLKSCGVNVSRTNAASYAKKDSWTLIESIDSLKKGDLVFFKNDKEERVSHTGIYIGGGAFIHASSSSGKVIKSSMSGAYWTRNFVCGRRVF